MTPPAFPEPPDELLPPQGAVGAGSTLTARTLEAGRWRSATLLAQLSLQFGATIVLARLLPPSDFGLAALAMVVIGFVGVVAEAGLGAALIYRRPLTANDVRVAFTLSMVMASALALALALLASPVAALFQHQSLTPILRAQAALFVLAAIGSTARGLLRRRLDFRRLFAVDVGSYLLGYALVAVTLAALGYGVWSLVLGSLVQTGLGSVLALALAPHPVRPLWSGREGRELLGYGAADTLNSMVAYAGRSADSLVIGRWLGVADLGLYTRAFSLFSAPLSYVSNAMTSVLFPAMAEIRDDVDRSRGGFYVGVQLVTLFAAPVSAGVMVAAPHLVVALYGERWLGAALPLQILASAGTLRAVYNLCAAVTYASGNVMAEVRRQAVLAALLFAGAMVGTRWGIAGVALGVVVGMLFMYFAMVQLSLRILEGTWRDFLAAHVPGVSVGVEVTAVALLVRWAMEASGADSLLVLIAMVAACGIALPLGMYLLPRRFRPTELALRLDASLSRLPPGLRRPMTWVLRLPFDG